MIHAMRFARVAVLVLALVSCAWFALGARQAQLVAQASSLISAGHKLSPAQARHAANLLDEADALNPDLQTDVLRGELATDQGHLATARAILARVIHREPKNLVAFQAYARASAGNETAFFAAQIGIHRLVRLFGPRG